MIHWNVQKIFRWCFHVKFMYVQRTRIQLDLWSLYSTHFENNVATTVEIKQSIKNWRERFVVLSGWCNLKQKVPTLSFQLLLKIASHRASLSPNFQHVNKSYSGISVSIYCLQTSRSIFHCSLFCQSFPPFCLDFSTTQFKNQLEASANEWKITFQIHSFNFSQNQLSASCLNHFP